MLSATPALVEANGGRSMTPFAAIDRPLVRACSTDTGPLSRIIPTGKLATPKRGDGVVSWETVSEGDNQGFHLRRGTTAAGPERRINAQLIPSPAPGSVGGLAYAWEDRDGLVEGMTYYYWLEDVDVSDVITRHRPVSVTYQEPAAVTLASLDASGAVSDAGRPWMWLPSGAALLLAALLMQLYRNRHSHL